VPVFGSWATSNPTNRSVHFAGVVTRLAPHQNTARLSWCFPLRALIMNFWPKASFKASPTDLDTRRCDPTGLNIPNLPWQRLVRSGRIHNYQQTQFRTTTLFQTERLCRTSFDVEPHRHSDLPESVSDIVGNTHTRPNARGQNTQGCDRILLTCRADRSQGTPPQCFYM
jgi:hypothetical protein